MAFFKNIFSGQKNTSSGRISTASLSKETESLIGEALHVIEPRVMIDRGGHMIMGAGSEGILMQAAAKFREAFEQNSEAALLHYAYASSLHLAMQFKTAEEEMKKCVAAFPDFPLAKLALEGWGRWQSMFMLPPWGKETASVHPALSKSIMRAVMLPVRDGIIPRSALFLRDARGDFQNLSALRSARIPIASVISQVKAPQVLGIYAKIYDDPNNPYDVEILDVPFWPRGEKVRSKYEYLCHQDEIDFAVIDGQDNILMNRRLPIPPNMQKTNEEILKMLQTEEGREISQSETMNAVMRHQQQFAPSAVRY